jgi:signal transduction histidine kinase
MEPHELNNPMPENKSPGPEFSLPGNLANALVDLAENERQRVGLALHDHVNQILASSLLYLNIAKKEETVSEHPKIIEAENLVKAAIHEINRLSRELSSPFEIGLELEEAFEDLCDNFSQSTGAKVETIFEFEDEENLPDKFKLSVYRMAQDYLNSAIKFAGAKNVVLTLAYQSNQLLLNIKADAGDFSRNEYAGEQILYSINARAILLNGEARIISSAKDQSELVVRFNIG